METRKRQIPEDGEATLSKKRALIDAHGSPTPHVNGLPADGDEPKDDNLEVRFYTFYFLELLTEVDGGRLAIQEGGHLSQDEALFSGIRA